MNPDVIYYPREAIVKAARVYPTPFFLYSEKDGARIQRFVGAFKKHFSDFQPLFAVKES